VLLSCRLQKIDWLVQDRTPSQDDMLISLPVNIKLGVEFLTGPNTQSANYTRKVLGQRPKKKLFYTGIYGIYNYLCFIFMLNMY
jgi:hypothetical protein